MLVSQSGKHIFQTEKERYKWDNQQRKLQIRLMDLLVAEERIVLTRIEEAVDRGEIVPPSLVKKWRSEIMIPVML